MLIEQNHTPKESSVISGFIYDFTTNALKIIFKSGQIYEYSSVPENVYKELCEAESHGKYFATNIKNNYQNFKLLMD